MNDTEIDWSKTLGKHQMPNRHSSLAVHLLDCGGVAQKFMVIKCLTKR